MSILPDYDFYPDSGFRQKEGLILEIGPGRGDFLFDLATERSEKTIVAVEYKRKRYEKLKERIQKRELLNVSLVWGNARFAIPELFTEGQLEEIYIFHPDPWPKTRHSKHRLLQTSFLNDLAVRMAPGGLLYIQTDDPPYSVEIQEALNKTVSLSPAEIMLNRSTRTLYEEKMKGKPLFTFKYRRC